MIQLDPTLTAAALRPDLERMFALSGQKIDALHRRWNPADGTPVFTMAGRYASRGWTEWTQGFQFGSALLQFTATGEAGMLTIGRTGTQRHMATHVSHIGVHDHGFNNVSTYGTLLHLAEAGHFACDDGERQFYRLALKVSGAVQAARWTSLPGGAGYIYSFNGPHSLFADTIRSLRVLALAHRLGHCLMGEHDERISLLARLVAHADATARYNVYFGTGRDFSDVPGRGAHESIFNLNDGTYRCPSSQQGYSPFTTWTRGLAWILCGFAEELPFLAETPDSDFATLGGKSAIIERFLATARATADFYLAYTPLDGVPYWDTGAPGLSRLGDYLERPADPFNGLEPVDSSAAAIAAQGLIRLALFLASRGENEPAQRYLSAGLVTARTLLREPYLSVSPDHEGLLLHSVYHRPNGWDYVPPGHAIPCGEACLWGDYHLRELALLLLTLGTGPRPYSFLGF